MAWRRRTCCPRPRNFTGGLYKIPHHERAASSQPMRTCCGRSTRGFPGARCPDWRTRLSDAERRNVMAYIKTFSSFFADTSQHVVSLKSRDRRAMGRATKPSPWGSSSTTSIGCRKCSTATRGGAMAHRRQTLKDDADFPIFRRRSAPELAIPRRRLGGGYLPAAAHGAGRHADAVVRRPDRSKVPHRRGAVAAGAVRGTSLSPQATARRTRRRSPCPRRSAARCRSSTGTIRHGRRVPRYWFPLVGQVIPQGPLVLAAGRVGRVGGRRCTRRHDAGPAGELRMTAPRSPDTAVAQVRAADSRDRRRRPTPQAPPKRSPGPTSWGCAIQPPPPAPSDGAALLYSWGNGDRTPSISGADPGLGPRRSPSRSLVPRHRAIRHPSRRTRRGGGLRAWRIAPGAHGAAPWRRPIHLQRSSAGRWPGDSDAGFSPGTVPAGNTARA